MGNADEVVIDAETGENLEGVLARRMIAFVFDYLLVLILVVIAGTVIGFLGVLTFGLAWLLYAILTPVVVIAYVALTLGGPEQATPGMKAMGLRLVRDDGKPVDYLLALTHSVLFWAFSAVLTPFILLVTLFNARRRTLHDILLGTNVIRVS